MKAQQRGMSMVKNTITLPGISKMNDEKGRQRWIHDYPKFESELLKHHLGSSDQTSTMCAKSAPKEFNRALPDVSEPTEAELAYNARMRAEKRQRLQKGSTPQNNKNSSTKAGNRKGKNQPFISNAAKSASYDETKMRALSLVDASPGAATVPSSPSAGRNGAETTRSVTSQSDSAVATASGSPTAGDGSASGSRKPVRSAANESTGAAGGSQKGVGGREAADRAFAAAPLPPTTVRAANQSEAIGSPRANGSSPYGKQKQTGTARQAASPSPSRRQPDTSIGSGHPTASSSMGAMHAGHDSEKGLEQMLTDMDAVQPRIVEPLSRSLDKSGVQRQSMAESALGNATKCARLLRTLLDAPREFDTSFQVDTRNMDLRWMMKGKDAALPFAKLTLDTSSFSGSATRTSINSPRSVLVILSNGLSVPDLIAPKSQKQFLVLGENMDDPETVSVVAARFAHHELRRNRVLETLRADYADLCAVVSIDDIMSELHNPELWHDETEYVPTSLAKQREKQQMLYASNRKRLEKQMEGIEEANQRKLAAEERREKALAEAQARHLEKKEAELEARRKAEERLQVARVQADRIAAELQQQIQGRMERVEESNKARKEAMQRHVEKLQKQREERSRIREERMQRKAATLESIKAEQEAKAQEKAETLARMAEEREERLRREHEENVARRKAVDEARALAVQRARDNENALREEAAEKQERVASRIAAFHEQKHADAQRRRELESSRDLVRNEIAKRAQEMEQKRKMDIEEKLAAHEDLLEARLDERRLAQLAQVEREGMDFEDKQFYLQRCTRADEFKKLESVTRFVAKRAAADEVQRQRQQIQDTLAMQRQVMEEEKLRFQRELESAALHGRSTT